MDDCKAKPVGKGAAGSKRNKKQKKKGKEGKTVTLVESSMSKVVEPAIKLESQINEGKVEKPMPDKTAIECTSRSSEPLTSPKPDSGSSEKKSSLGRNRIPEKSKGKAMEPATSPSKHRQSPKKIVCPTSHKVSEFEEPNTGKSSKKPRGRGKNDQSIKVDSRNIVGTSVPRFMEMHSAPKLDALSDSNKMEVVDENTDLVRGKAPPEEEEVIVIEGMTVDGLLEIYSASKVEVLSDSNKMEVVDENTDSVRGKAPPEEVIVIEGMTVDEFFKIYSAPKVEVLTDSNKMEVEDENLDSVRGKAPPKEEVLVKDAPQVSEDFSLCNTVAVKGMLSDNIKCLRDQQEIQHNHGSELPLVEVMISLKRAFGGTKHLDNEAYNVEPPPRPNELITEASMTTEASKEHATETVKPIDSTDEGSKADKAAKVLKKEGAETTEASKDLATETVKPIDGTNEISKTDKAANVLKEEASDATEASKDLATETVKPVDSANEISKTDKPAIELEKEASETTEASKDLATETVKPIDSTNKASKTDKPAIELEKEASETTEASKDLATETVKPIDSTNKASKTDKAAIELEKESSETNEAPEKLATENVKPIDGTNEVSKTDKAAIELKKNTPETTEVSEKLATETVKPIDTTKEALNTDQATETNMLNNTIAPYKNCENVAASPDVVNLDIKVKKLNAAIDQFEWQYKVMYTKANDREKEALCKPVAAFAARLLAHTESSHSLEWVSSGIASQPASLDQQERPTRDKGLSHDTARRDEGPMELPAGFTHKQVRPSVCHRIEHTDEDVLQMSNYIQSKMQMQQEHLKSQLFYLAERVLHAVSDFKVFSPEVRAYMVRRLVFVYLCYSMGDPFARRVLEYIDYTHDIKYIPVLEKPRSVQGNRGAGGYRWGGGDRRPYKNRGDAGGRHNKGAPKPK